MQWADAKRADVRFRSMCRQERALEIAKVILVYVIAIVAFLAVGIVDVRP